MEIHRHPALTRMWAPVGEQPQAAGRHGGVGIEARAQRDLRIGQPLLELREPGAHRNLQLGGGDLRRAQLLEGRVQALGEERDLAQRDADRIKARVQALKLLREFHPTHDWVLGPGDMLYLPPDYAHDGVAVGECMTCSIGFRAQQQGELAWTA